MRTIAAIYLLALCHAPIATAQDVLVVPSGLPVVFHEMIRDQPGQGLTFRFRFVAPEMKAKADNLDLVELEKDMAHLCREYALPRIASIGPQPNQIVISLADRPTKFGVADPDATQYFEGYSIDGDDCLWEPF